MKDLLHLSFVLLLGATALLHTGCGGGGGSDDDGNAGGAGNPSVAPQNIAGRSVQLSEVNRPDHSIQFAASGDTYLLLVPGEPQRSGTYSYSVAHNTATLRLVDASTGETTTFTLNFESEASGSYSYTSSAGRAGAGTFRNFTVRPNDGNGGGQPGGQDPGQGNSGGNGGGHGGSGNPGNGGNNSGGDTGGLNGKVLRLTRSTGQTHTYTFTETQFVDSDPPEEGTGTYTYTRTGSQATLILNYTGSNGPVNLAGDRHDIRFTFTTEQSGTYDSTYTTNEGAVLPQIGKFEFVQ